MDELLLCYAYVGIVCMSVITLILNRVLSTKFKETIDRPFARVLVFFLLFCAIDVTWGLVSSLLDVLPLLVFFTYSFHTVAAISSFACAAYGAGYVLARGKAKTALAIYRYSLFAVQLLVLFLNTVGHYAFDFTGGSYCPYPPRQIFFYLQFAQYLPVLVYSIGKLVSKKQSESAYLYRTGIYFMLTPPLFGVLQMIYPNQPFYSLGFMFVSALIYVFNVTAQREHFLSEHVAAEEREKSREQIEEALARAEAANAAKTAFLANMSHDIRTPINGIMGMVTIARGEEMNDKVRNCIGKIDTASHHLLSLVNDVLDMNRIESGRTEISSDPLDIRAFADNCNSIMLGQIEGKGIRYSCDFSGVRHAHVLGDTLHLRQVLINILGNAAKFTPEGGTITYTICEKETDSDEKAEYVFSVRDTGIGMKPEFLDKLFEPFAQENGGSRGKYQGTGLGMAISKKLIELMGGGIEVESTVGAGSCFTVTVPLVFDKTPAEASSAEKKAAPDVRLKGTRVLLAEDNELNQEIALTLLRQNGVDVTLADNGKQALDLFTENPAGTFDLILMDIMMPEMNGYEATRAIRALDREDAKSIPIFAMTANVFAEDRRKAQEAGMNAHIPKPIDFQTLLSAIANVRAEKPD